MNGEDANLEQVEDGMAWHYKKYQWEQSPSDRMKYSDAELEARRNKVGLWHDPNPVPPWDYRRADTPRGARASATCYSLIETAKANGLEPSAYLHHVLQHIAAADTLEKIEALLPWNMK